MSKKKNVSPSVDEAKLRIELYNNLCKNLKDLKRDQVRKVLAELNNYVVFLGIYHNMEPSLLLRYFSCTNVVFHYLYKTGQLSTDFPCDPEVRKHVEDVFITILKDYDATGAD